MYDKKEIEDIRNANDIVNVISESVELRQKGEIYLGRCPFHEKSAPSLIVDPKKQTYYCPVCGAGGNVFDFIMNRRHVSFPEAAEYLANRTDIPFNKENDEMKQAVATKEQILAVNKTAARFYYRQLYTPQGKTGLDYLHGRCLSDKTIRHFALGFAPAGKTVLLSYLRSLGFSDQLMLDAGLIQNKNGYLQDKFWNRVMFPILNNQNQVIGFGGRVMDDGKPKYMNTQETLAFAKKYNMYGLSFAQSPMKRQMILCEGYMDVITLHQAGFTNAVASLGTALTENHAKILKRYTDNVILTYDSDDAGINAAMRAIPILKSEGINCRILHMDPCKDPDEFIKNYGRDAFAERIDQAEDSFSFELSVIGKDYGTKSPEEKLNILQQAAEKIADMPKDERKRGLYLTERRFGISSDGMQKLVAIWKIKKIGGTK